MTRLERDIARQRQEDRRRGHQPCPTQLLARVGTLLRNLHDPSPFPARQALVELIAMGMEWAERLPAPKRG